MENKNLRNILFYFIIICFVIPILSNNSISNIITLKIKNNGNHLILGRDYKPLPNEIYVNGTIIIQIFL